MMIGVFVLAIASMALALSAPTPRVQFVVCSVSACWRSQGQTCLVGSLTLAGKPAIIVVVTGLADATG